MNTRHIFAAVVLSLAIAPSACTRSASRPEVRPTPTEPPLAVAHPPPLAPAPAHAEARAVPSTEPIPLERLPALVAPAVPAELAVRVRQLRRIAAATTQCFVEYGGRTIREPPDDCPTWYSQLVHGGRASAYAIGGYLLAPTSAERDTTDSDGLYGSMGERLTRILAETDAPEAAVFMLVALQRDFTGNHRPTALTATFLDGLERVSGYDPAPIPPWRSRSTVLRDAAAKQRIWASWRQWYAAHANDTRQEWHADGERRTHDDLSSTDPVVRFAAIKRLVDQHAQIESFGPALNELLARADLPGDARAYLSRFARRNHVAMR